MTGTQKKVTGIWQKIAPYFSLEEFTEPEKMSGLLLLILFELRFYSGWPLVINSTTGGIHCKNSFHYRGMAADFYLQTPNGSIPFLDQIDYLQLYLLEMQLEDSVGWGIYFNWYKPGFHLDVRGYKARWICREHGKYLPFTKENLRGQV